MTLLTPLAFFFFFASLIASAQTSSFRYEGRLQGPTFTTGTVTGQTFTVSIRRFDNCGGNLGLTPWTSSSVTLDNGAFSINPTFNASLLAQAMDPWNSFGASGCSVPDFRRNLIISWNSETFTIALEDAPRANLATYAVEASNATAVGGVSVQSPLVCSSNQILKFNSVASQLECQTLASADIPTLTVAQLPNLAGDLSGTLSTASVNKIKGVGIDFSTAPTTGQILKFNGTNWAPAADSAGVSSDATYSAKGLVQINTDLATSGLTISSGVLSLPNLISAGGPTGGVSSVPVITYDQKGRLTSVTTAAVNDSSKLPLTGGTMSGAINMGASNITNATSIAATNLSTRNVIIADNDSNTITVKAPTDATATYDFILPPTSGTSGYLLSTNGSGTLSWVAPPNGSGDITDVVAGAGLTGGATSGSATLDIGAGTGIVVNANDVAVDVGTTSGKIVQVQTGGRLPALDGSDLTNLDAGDISTGTLSIARGGTGQTTAIAALNALLPSQSSHSGKFLQTDGTNTLWVSANSGTVTQVSSANSYLSVGSATTTPIITANVGTAANTLAAGNDARITGALQTSAYNADVADIASCTSSQTVYWNTVSDKFSCQNINFATAGAFIDGGNTMTAAAVLGTNSNHNLVFETNGTPVMTLLANGRVGIGTSSPLSRLHVQQTLTDPTSNLDGLTNSVIANSSANQTGKYNGFFNEITTSGSNSLNQITSATFRNYSNSNGSLTETRGLNIQTGKSSIATGSTGTAHGIYNYLDNDGGAITKAVGLSNILQTNPTGTITNAYGTEMMIQNSGSMSTATGASLTIQNSSGTLTSATGLEVSVSGANITSGIGVKIGSVSGTSSYGLYQSDSTNKNYLAGNLGLGTTNPAALLHIQKISNGTVEARIENSSAGSAASSSIAFYGDSGVMGNVGSYSSTYSVSHLAGRLSVFSASSSNGLDLISSSTAGDMRFYTGGVTTTKERMRIDNAGNLVIGATLAQAKLDISDTSTTTSAILIPRAANFTGTSINGMVRYNTTSNLFEFRQNGAWVNFTAVSDERLKTNVQDISNGLDLIKMMRPVYFDWDSTNPRTQSFNRKHQVGFMAQELEKVLPEVVDQGDDTYRTVEYGKIVSVVVAALKELANQFKNTSDEIQVLKSAIEVRDQEIARLKEELETSREMQSRKFNDLEIRMQKLQDAVEAQSK